jgi:putative addiction module killer protein
MESQATDQFKDWMNGLRDLQGRARIQARIERLKGGNPGDHRVLGGGVCEMKIDVGPGYRVYYTIRGQLLLILLAGGDKSTQARDIELATKLCAAL